jgi:hypothetical protein
LGPFDLFEDADFIRKALACFFFNSLLERCAQEIAVEVVTTGEINCRERSVREFEWRVRRKAQLESGLVTSCP